MPLIAPSTHRRSETAKGRPSVAPSSDGGLENGGHLALASDCRKVRTVLDRVGEKWSILAIRMLSERPYRFNELRRALEGIT